MIKKLNTNDKGMTITLRESQYNGLKEIKEKEGIAIVEQIRFAVAKYLKEAQ
jgi:hypothetical protein